MGCVDGSVCKRKHEGCVWEIELHNEQCKH